MYLLVLTESNKFRLRLVGSNFHIIEILQQPRSLQFILLILQLSLRKHHHPTSSIFHHPSYFLQRLFHFWQRGGWQMEQALAVFQQVGEGRDAQVVACHTHGGLEDADGESLAAIAEVGHIARLRLKKIQLGILTIGRNQAVEVFLHSLEMRLTVPQRVIRIKRNHLILFTIHSSLFLLTSSLLHLTSYSFRIFL